MARQSADFSDRLKVYKVLVPIIEELPPEGETKMCRYKDGHSDDSVADKLGLGKATVANVRKAEFGQLRAVNVVAEAPDVSAAIELAVAKAVALKSAEIAALRGYLAKLATTVEEFADKYDRVCDTMIVNRLANVKHLKMKLPGHMETLRANGNGADHDGQQLAL